LFYFAPEMNFFRRAQPPSPIFSCAAVEEKEVLFSLLEDEGEDIASLFSLSPERASDQIDPPLIINEIDLPLAFSSPPPFRKVVSLPPPFHTFMSF